MEKKQEKRYCAKCGSLMKVELGDARDFYKTGWKFDNFDSLTGKKIDYSVKVYTCPKRTFWNDCEKYKLTN